MQKSLTNFIAPSLLTFVALVTFFSMRDDSLTMDELAHLPVEQLTRGKYQPRVDMRQEALEELAISIRNQGVIQPIVVRPIDD